MALVEVKLSPSVIMVLIHTNKYESDIKIIKDSQEVDGKSILGIMMLAVESGSEIKISVNGVDEKEAMKEIASLIDNNFYE